MKDLVKERLRERMLDARDWFEIRPDPHWWPGLGIPGVIALAYFTVPHNLLPFLLAGAVMMTLALGIMSVAAIALFVLGRTIRDVVVASREATATRREAPTSYTRAYR